MSDVEVCGANLALNHLRIGYCFGRGSIKVSAPNLTWLGVDDRSGKLLLQNMPKLVGADFMYRNQITDVVHHFSSAVSSFISQLKILNLSLLYPKVFLANKFPEMPNLNKLIVRYRGPNEYNLLPLTAIVWASPRLQEFKLQVGEPFYM